MTLFAADEATKAVLLKVFSGMRIILWISVLTLVGIEIAEVFANKEIERLVLFAIFFLLANLQIGIGRFMLTDKKQEQANQLLLLSVFMISSAFLEIIDVGLEKGLSVFPATTPTLLYQLLLGFEAVFGILALALAAYSVDRFFIQMRLVVRQLRGLHV